MDVACVREQEPQHILSLHLSDVAGIITQRLHFGRDDAFDTIVLSRPDRPVIVLCGCYRDSHLVFGLDFYDTGFSIVLLPLVEDEVAKTVTDQSPIVEFNGLKGGE